MKRWFYLFCFAVMPLLLTSCPRVAKIHAYNNTASKITLHEGHEVVGINSGEVGSISFGSDHFIVEMGKRKLRYNRVIPHGGENGPFFNGSIRAQINPNGEIFILKQGQNFPQQSFPDQPKGYPLKPVRVH